MDQTLINTFINEKYYTIQTLINLNFLFIDNPKLIDNDDNNVGTFYYKLFTKILNCTKTSIGYKITCKKVMLTDEETNIIKQLFHFIFENIVINRALLSTINVFVKKHNMTKFNKHNFNMIIFDTLFESVNIKKIVNNDNIWMWNYNMELALLMMTESQLEFHGFCPNGNKIDELKKPKHYHYDQNTSDEDNESEEEIHNKLESESASDCDSYSDSDSDSDANMHLDIMKKKKKPLPVKRIAVTKQIVKPKVVNKKNAAKYMHYDKKDPLYSFYEICKYKKQANIIEKFLELIEQNIYPDKIILACILENEKVDFEEIIKIFLQNGFAPDFSLIKYIMTYIQDVENGELVTMLLSLVDFKIIDHIEIFKLFGPESYIYMENLTMEDLKYIIVNYDNIKVYNKNYDNIITNIISMMNTQHTLSNTENQFIESLHDIFLPVCHYYHTIVLQQLFDLGVNITQADMITLCGSEFLNYITEGIEHFKDDEIIKILINNKLYFDFDCFKAIVKTYNTNHNIMKLLHNNGFCIDLNCIEYAFSQGYIIHNLEEFHIEYNIELYRLCCKYGDIPSEYMNGFVKSLGKEKMMLYEMFKFSSKHILKKYMILYNLTPDDICFKNALNHNKYCLEIVDDFTYSPTFEDILMIENSENRKKIYQKYYKSTPYQLEN